MITLTPEMRDAIAIISIIQYTLPNIMFAFVDEWDSGLAKVSALFKLMGALGLIFVVGW